jgi:hypothetical protein
MRRTIVSCSEHVPSRQPFLVHPEPSGDRRADVREAVPDPEVAGLSAAGDEERDALARVVGALKGRVVAMISGNDEEAFARESFEQLRHPVVEALKVLGHTARVAPVAILRVKVHEVSEDEARLDAS